MGIPAISQIQIGNGTNESQSTPIEPYYGYSYSQTIYLQSEINSAGNITGLQYFYSGVSDLANSNDGIEIYIGHSTKTDFISGTDWVAVSGMTLVYSGSLPAPTTPGVDEWLSITLTTPFMYNNSDNLVIAVDANEAGYDSSSDDFHCSSVGASRSIYYRSDSTNPDPGSPPSGVAISYIGNVILDGLTPSMDPNCAISETPGDGTTTDLICGGSIPLTWSPASSGPTPDSYDVYFGTTSGALSLLGNTSSTSISTSTLSPSTTYYWQVIPKAGANAASGCTEWSFTTASFEDSGSGDRTYLYNNTYAPGGPAYAWIDPIANGHNEITSWTSGSDDDGYFYVANMGITFSYDGTGGYMDCNIGSNGYVSLGSAGYTSTGSSTTLGSTSDPDNMIAACMMDLDDQADGRIFYATVGGNFVVTWYHYHDYGDASEWITFQLVMEGDANGGFTIHYNESESSASPDILNDAVIGAEFGDSEFIEYRTNGTGGPMFCSPLAVNFVHSLPLPVVLSYFKGEVRDDYNMLMWETSTEINTEKHILERSFNGRDNWLTINQVSAFGNSQDDRQYESLDRTPIAKGFYRLKSVDFDGHIDYSEIVVLTREVESFELMSLAPNPMTDRFIIQFQAPETGAFSMKILNLVGQELQRDLYKLESGLHNKTIDVSDLSPGAYFISLDDGFKTIVQKFIKQ